MNIYSKKLLGSDNKIPYGTVIYNSAGTTGSVTIEIPNTQEYFVRLVGGGAGGASVFCWYDNGQYQKNTGSGGAGGMAYGVIRIEKGTYTATIGAGGAGKYQKLHGSTSYVYSTAGSQTSFLDIYAKGGQRCGIKSGYAYTGGAGHSAETTGSYTTLTFVKGANGSGAKGINKASTRSNTASTYSTYGYGGGAGDQKATTGGKGYLYIEAR